MKHILILALSFIIPLISAAADQGFVIDSFNSDIQINQEGVVLITETIVVDFSLNKHGIYRELPYRYQGDKGFYYTDLVIQGIERNGLAEPYKIESDSTNKRIRIGDPDKLITNLQTYEIKYQVSGVLQNSGGVDELYWNVTGNDWQVPIKQASARINLPTEIRQYSCYQGNVASTNHCQVSDEFENSIEFSTGDLNPGQGLTVAVGWDKGQIPLLRPNNPANIYKWLIYLLPFITTGLTFWYWFKRWRKFGRDPKVSETIVTQYQPPTDLTPAEVGILIDDKISSLEIAAAIMELARQGFIIITQKSEKFLLINKTSFVLERVDNPAADYSLSPHESLILNRLFKNGRVVETSDLKNSFYQDIKAINDSAYHDVYAKGLYSANPDQKKLVAIVGMLGMAAYLGISLLSGLISNNYNYPHLTWFIIIAFLAPLIITAIFTTLMPQRTIVGTKKLEHVLGYKQFIETAEKHRAKFYENENLVFEIMPYAVVFGLAKKFSKAVQDMGIRPTNPDWLVGSNSFALAELADFSTDLNSTIASKPGGGGSGGVGSVGGGFGGGGGGSW